MDLLGKVAIIVIVLIVVVSGAILLLRHSTSSQLTKAQAVAIVLRDVKENYPGANVTLINVSNSTLESNSYNIVLSIVYNSTSPCPIVGIEQFDYPALQLSSSYPNYYTQGHCIIVNLNSNPPTYVISSPEVAIARSYNQSIKYDIKNVTDYVNGYGYYNTSVSAMLYSYLNNNMTHLSQSYYNVWLVHYTATNANYSVYAVMYANGTIVDTYLNNSA
jgi:hypothetical protein